MGEIDERWQLAINRAKTKREISLLLAPYSEAERALILADLMIEGPMASVAEPAVTRVTAKRSKQKSPGVDRGKDEALPRPTRARPRSGSAGGPLADPLELHLQEKSGRALDLSADKSADRQTMADYNRQPAMEKLVAFVMKNPGTDGAAIAKHMKGDRHSIRPIVGQAIRQEMIRTEGIKRGTRYFPR